MDPTTAGALAAALFAVDPVGLGGVWLRHPGGPARDAWLRGLQGLLPDGAPLRRVPLRIDDERLLGGLDLGATLRAGRPVALPGLLAQAQGGVLVVAMAERIERRVAAHLAAALDGCELGVIALDEGIDDETPPAALLDRLGLAPDFDPRLRTEALEDALACWTRDDIAAARARLASIAVDEATLHALGATAMALGVASLRAPLLALRAARAAAALDGRDAMNADDATIAARLVLAPRATRLPANDDVPNSEEPDEAPPDRSDDESADASADADRDPADTRALDDIVLEAAQAAIPAGLLTRLLGGPVMRSRSAGRAGALQKSSQRGRPIGARRGDPRGGARLDLLQTLRSAAPWQRLRQAARTAPDPRIAVRREDFHVKRFAQRSPSCTLFVVDASGSAALHRLAEAKGAVELLLAECYVRRDSVAVLGFRGRGAELLLPPTRSLVRAKRALAGLPGGGGTPLAAGIVGAGELADAVRRHGDAPVVVLLTDGRANIALDGSPGRERAHADALAAARRFAASGVAALLIDTAAQPQAVARELAQAMGARYLPLPHAGAAAVSQAVRVIGGV